MGSRNMKSGFTLVELMIVVAIISILAAVAIPSFSYFITHSKKNDGRDKLTMLSQGALVYFKAEHFFDKDGLDKRSQVYPGCQKDDYAPFVACGATDNTNIPEEGTKEADPAGYDRQPWKRLGFAPSGPLYYGFAYRSSVVNRQSTFTACAIGNLRKNNTSKFQIAGQADGRLTAMTEKDLANEEAALSDCK